MGSSEQLHVFDPGIAASFSSEYAEGKTDHLRARRLGDMEDYTPLEIINRGGQGIVYKALQKSTGRLVAVKVLLDGPTFNEEHARRFAREISLLSRIRHPHIVTLYGSGFVDGRPYYAMEYVDGIPIHDYVFVNQYSVHQCITLFEKVCRAVDCVHQYGVLHRDLKPGNILVNLDGEPCILDFGLAKCTGLEHADSLVSIPGKIVGTLPFLSPEQAAGDESSVGVCSDVYALGVILYRMLTGDMPYPVSDDPVIMRRHIVEMTPRPLHRITTDTDGLGRMGRLSDDLSRITLKALAKEPHRRYATAADFADDLARYLRGDAVHAKADSVFYVLRRKISRHRGAVVTSVLMVLLLIGFLVGLAQQRRRTELVTRESQAGLQMGSFLRLGGVRRDARRIDPAVAMLKKAIEIGSTIRNPDVFNLRMLHDAHHNLAQLYLEDPRQLAACEAHIEQSFECAQRLTAHDNHDYVAQRMLAYSHCLKGRLAMKKDDLVTAAIELTRSVSLFESVPTPEVDPSTRLANLCYANHNLARALHKLGQTQEALERLKVVRQQLEQLHQQTPDSFEYLLDLAMTESRLAEWHLREKTLEGDNAACEHLNRSRVRLENAMESGLAESRMTDARLHLNTIDQNQALADRRYQRRLASRE